MKEVGDEMGKMGFIVIYFLITFNCGFSLSNITVSELCIQIINHLTLQRSMLFISFLERMS